MTAYIFTVLNDMKWHRCLLLPHSHPTPVLMQVNWFMHHHIVVGLARWKISRVEDQ